VNDSLIGVCILRAALALFFRLLAPGLRLRFVLLTGTGLLPYCAVLSAVPPAKESALLFPDGGFYRGEINEQFQRHGAGSMCSADGAVVSEGIWSDDRLLTAVEVTTLALAALSPSSASSSSSASAAAPAASPSPAPPADSSECVVCQDARPDCHTGCAHICMCMQCAASIDTCPIGREPVTQRVRVFIS